MTMRISLRLLFAVALLWTAPSWSGEASHWDYDGAEGPARWGQLRPDYSACAEGRSQSPIDLPSVKPSDADRTSEFNPADLETHPEEGPEQVLNNGHTVQVDFPDGDSLVVGNEHFRLVQLHFHAPSEHTVAGRGLPMEMHLVHRSDSGVLAVLGVLIAEGSHNPAYDPIWSLLPREVTADEDLSGLTLDLDGMLPKRRLAYRYAGSLTTPPCSEGVRWLVLAEPVELSAEQIATFVAIYDHNNRPTQPLHGRSLVLEKID